MRVTATMWTEAEMKILREVYPTQGVKECARLLPNRAEGSIVMRASQFKIRRLPGTVRRPGSGRRPGSVRQPSLPMAPHARKASRPAAAPPTPPVVKAHEPPKPPKPRTLVLKAEAIRPGMIVNRYPVGTSAAPALREVTEARFSDSGARVLFNLAWRPSTAPKGKHEMPAAFWDFYRNPDLSFEVYADLAGGLLS